MTTRPRLSIVKTSRDGRAGIGQLRQRLAAFKEAYEQCDYIDHWPSAQRCMREQRYYIDAIEKELALREAEDDEHQDKPAQLWRAGKGDGE